MKKLRSYLAELSCLEQLTIVYLALPVALFYLGWLQPLYGIVCSLLLALLVFPNFNSKSPVGCEHHSLHVLGIAALIAIVWCCFGGAGHLFYANEDWYIRDAVVRDLVVFPWPVNYSPSPECLILLRAPIGYYLVPAAIAKVIGPGSGDYLLLGWTITGVALLFFLIAASWRKRWQLFLIIAIFILFSGMDIVGSYIMSNRISLTAHLEFWAKFFQYSSMTTVLYWVPNHGLPGWLAAAMFTKNWHNPRFLPTALIVTSIMPLWSPLTAIGTLLLLLSLFIRHWSRGEWKYIFSVETIIAGLIALPIAAYLTLNAGQVPSGWFFKQFSTLSEPVVAYLKFITVELAILPFVIFGEFRFKTGYGWLTASTSCFLLLLPCYYLGGANDFVMRVSIPLLAVIALRSAAVLIASIERKQYILACLMIVIFATGSVTPVCETSRVILEPRWQPDLTQNLVDITKMSAPHYYVSLKHNEIPMMLKNPSLE